MCYHIPYSTVSFHFILVRTVNLFLGFILCIEKAHVQDLCLILEMIDHASADNMPIEEKDISL